MRRDKRLELRVGAFVLLSVLLGGGIAFIIGNQRNVFSPKTTYTAVFDSVGGLRAGSPVQLGGVVVGSVIEVRFQQDGRIRVTFRVINDAARLVRGDVHGPHPDDVPPGQPKGTTVSIGSKGMLGDRLVDLTIGDQRLPEWDPSVPLPTARAAGLLDQAEAVMEAVRGTASNLRSATDPFADQQFSNDLKETANNLARVSGMLANGDGAIQRLMSNPGTADQVEQTLSNLQTASQELSAVSRSVRQVADEIAHGDGSVHRLIYEPEAAEAAHNIGRASDELALLLHDVREGDGTVHDLIYEDTANDLMQNLTSASADIAHITAEIRAGRGTLGGLLVDPSIYEDVKRLVGDLQRNDILRALVRYSIRRDAAEESPSVERE